MRAPLLLAVLLTASLAGCAGDDGPLETVAMDQNDVDVDDSASRTLDCGFGAELHVDIGTDEGGRLTVVVEDGAGSPVHNADYFPGDAGDEVSLAGSSGTWAVTAHRSLELDSPFLVELSC